MPYTGLYTLTNLEYKINKSEKCIQVYTAQCFRDQLQVPVQAWHAADCPGCGPAGHLLHGDWAVHQAARPRPRPGQARHAAGASQYLFNTFMLHGQVLWIANILKITCQ